MIRNIIIFLSIFATVTVTAQDTGRYFDLMGEADKAIANGQWSEAEEKLLEALRSQPANPSNILLMSNLGMVQYHAGRYDEAIATLNDAHYMAPASVTVLLNRARVLAETGHIEDAYRDYGTIMKLDTTLVEPCFYHAMIALDSGDSATTAADITRMKQIDESHRLTSLAEATMLISTGKYADAIPPLSRVIEKEPAAEYYASRALCRLMTSQLGDAADDIASGIELDPLNGELYLYRAMLNKMRYRPDDARKDADRAIELGIKESVVKSMIF